MPPILWHKSTYHILFTPEIIAVLSAGSLDGGFSFDLSDGKNVSPRHFFSVSAHQELVISLVNKQDLTVCPGELHIGELGAVPSEAVDKRRLWGRGP